MRNPGNHIIFLSILWLFPLTGFCQTDCQAEVSYRWQREGEEQETTVPYALARIRAADEASAQASLKEELARTRVRAANDCRRQHENLSGCIAAKFSSLSSVLQRLGFGARKALEEAVAADCATLQGVCRGVDAAEPVCTSPNEGKAEEGKEEKGKKKK